MKKILLLALALVFVGAGCITVPVSVPSASSDTPTTSSSIDPYDGWTTIKPGGVVSLRIPPNCHSDALSSANYIVCPENEGDTPPPDMVITWDGDIVKIIRWEGLEWEHRDKVIESLKVLTPMTQEIQINIQK